MFNDKILVPRKKKGKPFLVAYAKCQARLRLLTENNASLSETASERARIAEIEKEWGKETFSKFSANQLRKEVDKQYALLKGNKFRMQWSKR